MSAMLIETFSTPRLIVRHWRSDLAAPSARAALEAALSSVLTPPVLAHLPPSMQLSSGPQGIGCWIDARQAESTVFVIETRAEVTLAGLLILAPDQCNPEAPTVHIGYLLAQSAWGQGYASELVAGLVEACQAHAPLKLVGGVDLGNPASARVLLKAGFALEPEYSSGGTAIYGREIAVTG
ncbi:GNAT family N-acetyltransferase [Pacificoceanicola onchidii]|uniref:GNAT family N-acetyltransferase n=1 Tax=Pacificoceanicola onchidii TaxID=2562685 RepID=UPI0014561A25|nr:GNAT family N-acetyltransferase [Pacificoceanicola onchidii]